MIGIGHSTGTGAEIHLAGCNCAICHEHRELTAIIDRAEDRGWIVHPASRQRLAEIEVEHHLQALPRGVA